MNPSLRQFGWLLGIFLLLSGCESKAKAKREQIRAFQAGQVLATHPPGRQELQLFVRGLVRKSAIAWEPGITLSQALLRAEYYGRSDPLMIQVLRKGVRHEVDVHRFLRGLEDPEMLPNDVVDLQ